MDRAALLSRLDSGFLVASGANGSLLQAAGLPAGHCPDAWNLEQPAQVELLARRYREAGADLLKTNTFRANRITLEAWGLADQASELNQAGVRLARAGAGDGALIAGNLGPTGKLLAPLGDFPPEAAREAFREQAQALAAAGADLLLVETMYSLDELRLAVEAAAATGLAVLATMTFERHGRTMMGVSPQDLATLLRHGAAGVGHNCGDLDLDQVLHLVARLVAAAQGAPVVVQPNAGIARLESGQVVYPESPQSMALWAKRYLEAGARVIGACCGSTPEHIRALAAALRA